VRVTTGEWISPDLVQRLLIFGAGGFGREVAWLAESALLDSVRHG
jgi:hypothetical protein